VHILLQDTNGILFVILYELSTWFGVGVVIANVMKIKYREDRYRVEK